jgi:hydroxypyruvate reductase
VRKHLSAIKGGRLAAAAYPASVLTLAISDVPGADPAVIASGPTVGDPTTCADALRILDAYAIAVPPELRQRLQSGELETPKPGDPRLARSEFRLIASPRQMLEAAAAEAHRLGVMPLILGDALEGEAREVGKLMAGMAKSCAQHGFPAAKPGVLLSGGETTVTVRGQGRGGRNTEFLLALALALDGAPGIHALAADTDGIDGSEDNAGALIGPDTLRRAKAAGLDVPGLLANNDAWACFSQLGDLLVTGPTRTNVNDFRAILIG